MLKKTLLYLFVFATLNVVSQTIPRFKKLPIAKSGCFAYFPETPTNFATEYSEDSSLVYTGSIDFSDYTYGIVAVKFKTPLNIASSELENILISYMDFLKTTFKIKNAVGYGKGHTHRSNAKALGIIDYWEDEAQNSLAIKGWIDSKYIGFLYLKGKGEYPYFNAQEMFLNGFTFGD